MTTQNSAIGDEEPEMVLDVLLNDVVDYIGRMQKVGSPVLFLGDYKKKALDKLKSRDQQIALAARLDERKQVALDNYHGHTFSDATNYKGKFDKFIENNERRIKTLKQAQNKEK